MTANPQEHTSDLMEIVRLIRARLREEMPAGIAVESLADLAELGIDQWPAPAVLIVLGDYAPIGSPGQIVDIRQTIHVVSTVLSAGGHGQHDATQRQGGEMSVQVIAALHNWVPGSRYERLTLQPGQAIEFAPGRALFPLAFQTDTSLMGSVSIYDEV